MLPTFKDNREDDNSANGSLGEKEEALLTLLENTSAEQD